MFKVFKAEVENQLDLKIKVVISDRGGDFYGRFDEARRNLGPFARFLQQEGIVAQYTNPGTPQQNGVFERRNKTLKDMMRSMIARDVPFSKGVKMSMEQSPKTEQEKLEMVDKPYASLVGSLMYAQVCTRPDLAFPVSILGRFQSNPGQAHWVAAKKVLRYS
ncbi:unnamed protein product [Prunus brigantina]